jgi:peptide chain release factor 3
MTFEYGGCTFNLLDTPGHEDFSEDTYRTLTAVDSAVMVIDAAKGIEPQTRKLFEVCRLRDVPIMTFVNKMDREAKDPIELLDELADKLQLDIAPMNWPVGMGQNFRGVFDFASRKVVLLSDGDGPTSEEAVDRRSNSLALRVSEAQLDELDQTLELVEGALPAFDQDSYRQGHLSPAFFGSALKNFGVRAMLDGLASHAPSPRPQPSEGREVEPAEDAVTGFVFKVQANMDPKHRDRVAFVRLCSGRFRRGMKLTMVRHAKQIAVSTRSCSSPRSASWRRRRGPATSSACPTTASSRSATP